MLASSCAVLRHHPPSPSLSSLHAMPLYDTFTLGGDKQPVVLEFGFAYTR